MIVIYSHYFSETHYQYLRVIDYHIDCKEWRIERQLDSSWEGIYQYLVTIDALTIEICLGIHTFVECSLLQPCSNWGFSTPLKGITLPALHCRTCKVLLPSSSADTEVSLTSVRKCADFTHPRSVSLIVWHWLFTLFLLYDFTEVTVSISILRNLKKSWVTLMILKCVLVSL